MRLVQSLEGMRQTSMLLMKKSLASEAVAGENLKTETVSENNDACTLGGERELEGEGLSILSKNLLKMMREA